MKDCVSCVDSSVPTFDVSPISADSQSCCLVISFPLPPFAHKVSLLAPCMDQVCAPRTNKQTRTWKEANGGAGQDADMSGYQYGRVSFSRSSLHSPVHLAQSTSGLYHYNLKSRSHTHPSHSQSARLLTSSMSLGFMVPHDT